MAFSILISYILLKFTSGPFLKIVKFIAVIGIIFHELCHLLMCIISRTPIEDFSLIKRVKSEKSGESGFYGVVHVQENKISFLQAFLVSFAPLYISFWVFFFLLDFLIKNQVSVLIFVLCIFSMVSLVLSASPSFRDLKIVPQALLTDKYNTLYQIVLILFSILTTWIIVLIYDIQFIHEIFIYLIIASFYLTFKYGISIAEYGIRKIYRNHSENNRKPQKIRFKAYTRRRYKPRKPYKEW